MSPSSPRLRIIFAGTPEFAAAHLQVLLDSPHEVVACYTQPDRPAGRGKKYQASPVKQLALEHQLPVEQPPTLKDAVAQAALASYQADIMVVVAYGLLLPQVVLDTPRLGCINVHASLLPRWRGAAPIQRAIEAGDEESGITIMQMDAGLDTGDMLVRHACPITSTDTGASLHDRLLDLGSPALLQALSQLAQGSAQPEPQDNSLSTYAAKITKAEAALDWRQSARTLDAKVRAFNPFPIAHTASAHAPQARIRVWQAQPVAHPHSAEPGTLVAVTPEALLVATGEDCLALQTLQLPGKRAMAVAELLRGYPDLFRPGDRMELPA